MCSWKALLTLVVLIPILFLLGGCSGDTKITTSSPQALKWYQNGVSLYEKFYYREAQDLITKAIEADSGFALAWARRAIISFYSHDEAAAKEDITRALQLSGGASRSEQMLIRMWKHRISYEHSEAASTADSIIDRYPDLREPYLVRGQLYELNKNNESAIKMYQRAVDLDSTYAPAVMSLGYAFSGLGDVDKAAAYMERYIRLLPKEADPRASYGDVLMRAGLYDEALEQYQKSLEAKPDYWYSLQRIGDIYVIEGRLRAAEELYHKALDLLPASKQIAVSRHATDGRLSALRGDYEGALVQFREALSIDERAGDPAWGMLYALTKLKRFSSADTLIADIRSEMSRRNLLESSAMSSFYLICSFTMKERGEYSVALAACDSALQYGLPVNRGSIYNEIADIRLRQKEFELALDACEEALSVKPNSPDILLTLLKIYSAKKDVRMKVEIGSRLLAIWADADKDYVLLKEAQQIMGRSAAASW
jgi:tetratricopeptide (TPR) repeat protein